MGNGLTGDRANRLGLGLGVRYSPLVRCIVKCNPCRHCIHATTSYILHYADYIPRKVNSDTDQ